MTSSGNPPPGPQAQVQWIWSAATAGLSALPPWAQHRGVVLYAAAPAQRLMDWHDGLPASEQRPYSRLWEPVLQSIWSYAAGDDRAWYPISHALGNYYLSPQNHIEGQDGPDDADQDEVAATIFAANAVVHGLVGFAVLAAGRATDYIDNRWYGADEKRLVTDTKAEVVRQRSALDLIVESAQDKAAWRPGAPKGLIAALRSD